MSLPPAWVWPKQDDKLTPYDRFIRNVNVAMKRLENALGLMTTTLQAVGTFTNGATTPNIALGSVWKTNNSAPTSITNFGGGDQGKQFTLIAGDANTTIVHDTTKIRMRATANRTLALNEVTSFATYDGAVWYEVPVLKLDDLATPDDNTDLDASVTRHGLLKKLPGGTSTFLRGDGSFAAPAAPAAGYDPGTVTLATDQFLLQDKHLYLTASERMTLVGTAEVLLTDFGNTATRILGNPKTLDTSFTVPHDYFHDQLNRVSLAEGARATLVGTADLILTDDFSTRSRVVLAGRG